MVYSICTSTVHVVTCTSTCIVYNEYCMCVFVLRWFVTCLYMILLVNDWLPCYCEYNNIIITYM